ncbi:MAG: RloB family protein [Rickettsiales bacterium]
MAGARSDKLHQKAKRKFARKPPTKSPRDRILIVCEGEKTEPHYFEELCRDLNLSINTEVKIFGKECGSAPSSVYDYTIQELEKDLKDTRYDNYDIAYCVFDKDNHDDNGGKYRQTLDKIKKNKKFKIIAANSVPCFEFWVLLHFESTTSQFKNSTEVTKRIKTHWKEYSKEKTKDLYAKLKDKTDMAIKNGHN